MKKMTIPLSDNVSYDMLLIKIVLKFLYLLQLSIIITKQFRYVEFNFPFKLL